MPPAKNPETAPDAKTRKPRTVKPEKIGAAPVRQIQEQPECHVNYYGVWQIDDIRENVCIKDEPLTEFEGKHYCLFHLPTKDKDVKKFEEKFRERLKTVEEKLKAIEMLPEAEQPLARAEISYDFRYVWFPSEVDLLRYKFWAEADFSSAVFSADADFSWATFSADAYFSSATFSAVTKFNSATFSTGADFNKAIFSANSYFNKTKFTDNTQFTEANFARDVFFDETEFRNEVYFNALIFGKDSDVFFRGAFFDKNVNFQYCTADGYLRFSNLRLGEDCEFDFQEAAFEKASRIGFHTVRLFPNWFVNIDSRKFVFTDIDWQNLSYQRWNANIRAELENLEQRGIKGQNKRLLEVAARQLAVNAEENNRYEEAADFRYFAMETRRLEERKKLSFSRYLSWLYKWTSGYGERWSWAALVLIALLLFFGFLYASPLATFDYGEKANEQIIPADTIKKPEDLTKKYDARFHNMNVGEGIVHSLYVAALQRPEPKAADTTTRLFIILETIFAPLQIALLALAIRRKFMR